jgi:2-methylisocitrate lyase-like PEP mutase family enzyme
MTTIAERRQAFRDLHQRGCFVLPNPWDIGTARVLLHLGFPALATTSAGFAFSRGLSDTDGRVPVDAMLAHIAELVDSTPLPVNADFESGYAPDPEGVAVNVRRCVEAGVAGLSIEDATGDRAKPLHERSSAIERIRAAREAIDRSGAGVLLTGRSECFLVGHPNPLEESIARLQAYSAAGADVLYAPGLRTREQIAAVVAAVAPKPVNVLMSGNTGLRVADVAALGARRISLGSGLARAAWGGFLRAARKLAEGSFEGLEGAEPFAELNRFFREHPARD